MIKFQKLPLRTLCISSSLSSLFYLYMMIDKCTDRFVGDVKIKEGVELLIFNSPYKAYIQGRLILHLLQFEQRL